MLNRRQFIRISAGSAAAVVAACSEGGKLPQSSGSTSPASTTLLSTSTSTASTTSALPPATGSTVPGTTIAPTTTVPAAHTGRTLVVVQLNGGNDALNTMVPLDGRYHDARPTLGLADDQLVALAGADDWGLHPSLAPLALHWQAGDLGLLPGIGFAIPDRSHFVSMDRWWRADNTSNPAGWLGRDIAGDPKALYATALGSGAPIITSELFHPAVVVDSSTFAFPESLPGTLVRQLSAPSSSDAIAALAQDSLASAVDAVEAFASIAGAEPSDDVGAREGGFNLAEGLDLAARLVLAESIGVTIVIVSVGGFDTHANQLDTHAALLADFATGITGFLDAIAAGGAAERTLLVTRSEFGRRVAENASGGCDHGAGGLSMMFGPMVRGGIHGAIDLGQLLDGDIMPVLDPRTMYTACLDWLGQEPEVVLGRRYDEAQLLR